MLVTSLLRTPYTVKRLRRVNRNATDSSTHQFATTFDISYRRFHCLDSTRTVNEEDLKNLLGEVLLDLRREEDLDHMLAVLLSVAGRCSMPA